MKKVGHEKGWAWQGRVRKGRAQKLEHGKAKARERHGTRKAWHEKGMARERHGTRKAWHEKGMARERHGWAVKRNRCLRSKVI